MTKKQTECPYCQRPADDAGSIFHVGGCTALQEIPMNRLQYDLLQAEIQRLRAALEAILDHSYCRTSKQVAAEALAESAHEPNEPSSPVQLTQASLDALISEADKYILPVDVKMGAATFRKGVKVGTMLRGLKSHAEREIADGRGPGDLSPEEFQTAWRNATMKSAGEPHDGGMPCHPDSGCTVCYPHLL